MLLLLLSQEVPVSPSLTVICLPNLVLPQLSQSLSENQHNMMNKFCKMMKIFV